MLISVLGVANLGLFIQITFFCAIKFILPLFRAFIAALAARVVRLFFLHSVLRKKRGLFMSAYSGQVLNGFSEGKKLVACFLKSKPLILKSEPLIFSFLPRGYNTLKISFHFFPLKTPVLRRAFSIFQCTYPHVQYTPRQHLYTPPASVCRTQSILTIFSYIICGSALEH